MLFGLGEDQKPRAASFDETQAEAALKLADSMKLNVLSIDNSEQAAIAAQLQPGRLYVSGKGFVPYIRQELYRKISALAGASPPEGTTEQGSAAEPLGSDAGETTAEAKSADAGVPAEGTPASAKEPAPASTERPAVAPEPQTPVRGLPSSWDAIEVGHLVIAQESVEDGWWEAIVLEKDQDLFTLRWRDFPKLPKFVRHRLSLALACPTVR